MVRKQQSNQAVLAARERVRKANSSAQKAFTIRNRLPDILMRLKSCKYLSTVACLLHTLGRFWLLLTHTANHYFAYFIYNLVTTQIHT